MNTSFENKLEKNVKEIFQTNLKEEFLNPPVYMQTRILARYREYFANKVTPFWGIKKLIVPIVAIMLVVIWKVHFFSSNIFLAQAGIPMLVKVEINQLDEVTTQIAYTKVILPTDIQFYSKSYANISNQRSLILNWEKMVQNNALPFVVVGKKAGPKVIVVNFYDKFDKLLFSKKLHVSFNGKHT